MVEIHSTTSRRTDTKVKRSEYADAGIGHYWMVDLLGGPSLTACRRAGDLGYRESGPLRGLVTLEAPFPVPLDLDGLV